MANRNRAFTLIESVIYVALAALFAALVASAFVHFSVSYRSLRIARAIDRSATIVMERISREVIKASNVDPVGSVLNQNPGRLKLITSDQNGLVGTISFALENGFVNVYEDDVLAGRLTSNEASTTNLIFRLINTPKSQAVKIELTLVASRGNLTRTENFYDTVILSNSR